ncbi:MAG TPA: TauD/TfdA family dioxygenase [Sporichthyaceae bacterium]|jgi:alpha-ketoglutarate-dependent taurine dioxygenase|nr:TauD/TfdA family dioxygenase [Sporichthyaceae bacterium]
MPSAQTLRSSVLVTPGKPALLTTDAGGDPAGWASAHRDALREVLNVHGALLVRGLGLTDVASAGAAFRGLSAELMTEREAFAAREDHGGGVHSATKWPANQQMCMHHELSYTVRFPGVMMFACTTAPAAGGATVVADAAAVLAALPGDLVARFEREGWILTRSYNDEIGASWEEAFGTDDRAEVEGYCKSNGIAFEWTDDDGLRTRQRRSAILTHPVTGARTWFNQVAFLNSATLAEEVREYLVEEYGIDGLPFNTRFGNGEEITADVVATINEVYEAHTVREPWQSGDLLLVDNIACSHGREPYSGDREVLAALADPIHVSDCAPTVEVTL